MTNVCVDWINLVEWKTRGTEKWWESNSNSISKVTKFSFSWLTGFFISKNSTQKVEKRYLYGLSSHSVGEIFEWHANGCFKMGTFFILICLFCIITFMKWLSWALKTISLYRLNVKRRQMKKHQTSSVTLMENYELRNVNRFIETLFIGWVVLLFSMTAIDRQNFIVIPIRSFLSYCRALSAVSL